MRKECREKLTAAELRLISSKRAAVVRKIPPPSKERKEDG